MAARPLRVHELDGHAFGSLTFDPNGLIVAVQDEAIVGFVHAGFGPDGFDCEERPSPGRLNRQVGTIAMMIVDSERAGADVENELIRRAEEYLRGRGARVVYLGGRYPLNPFYWGLYGGSECAGVLSTHRQFNRAARELGYEPAGAVILLEADLDQPLPRDPRAVVLKRQSQISFHEDATPRNWWESLALTDFHLTRAVVTSKSGGGEIAHAGLWDMSWFSRTDGRARIGVIDVEVAPPHRRNGYGRLLLAEVLRSAREQMFAAAQVQTDSSNEPALALYGSLGFQPIDEATLYRLPADRMDRG